VAREPQLESREAHILKRLGHISVNPTDPENRLAISSTYLFTTPPVASNQECTVSLNSNPTKIKQFIDRIVAESHRQARLAIEKRRSVSDDVSSSQRLFLIHAPRGAGKTSFLNYALSRWSQLLDDKRVVWVRVDLVKDFFPHNKVESWIYAQLAKIAFRYYSSRSAIFAMPGKKYDKPFDLAEMDLEGHVWRYIEGMPLQEHRLKLADDFAKMLDVFSKNAAERLLSEDAVNETISQQVFQFLLKNSISVIVILDGFDRLEATPEAIDKFVDLMHQITYLAETADPIGYPIVFVSRTSTQRFLAARTYRRVPAINTFPLQAPQLLPILERRMRYLRKEVPALATSRNWSLHDWPQHVDGFLEYLKSSDGERDYMKTLEVFGQNRRAQLQVIQLAYIDYLTYPPQERGSSRQRPRRQYRLIETMVKSGYAFAPRHYAYAADGGKIIRSVGDQLGYDNRFLPSIFAYPVTARPAKKDFKYTNRDSLCGLRLLQLVAARDLHMQSGADTQALTVLEIMQLLDKLFGYDQGLVRRLCEEYVEAELLYVYNEALNLERDRTLLRVGAMPKLNRMLDEFVFDLSYLSLSIMRAPIGPFDSGRDAHRLSGLLRLVRYDREGDDLMSWIAAKAVNSITAYRMVREINSWQEAEYQERKSRIGSGQRWRGLVEEFEAREPFSIATRMRSSLLRELKGMLETEIEYEGGRLAPVKHEKIAQALGYYEMRWT